MAFLSDLIDASRYGQMKRALEADALKKQYTQAQTQDAEAQAELRRQDVLKGKQSIQPITESLVTPQVKAQLGGAFSQPAPVEDLISGHLDTLQKGIDTAKNTALAGQEKYGDLNPTQFKELQSANASIAKVNAPPKKNTELSPEATALYAAQFRQSGQMPSLGMGGSSARIQIMEEAARQAQAEGQTGEALNMNRAVYHASMSELNNVQKNRGMIEAFANTALKNLDLAEGLSDVVGRTGVPVLNRWIVAGKKAVLGDPETAKFDAAMRTAINEYARVVTTVTGGGVTSDSARKEIEDLLNSAQNPEQVKGVIQTLKSEIGNRSSGYDEQINKIKASISRSGQGIAPPSQAQSTFPTQTQNDSTFNTSFMGAKAAIQKGANVLAVKSRLLQKYPNYKNKIDLIGAQ